MEWAEYKIKETNLFTVDKYQQVNLSYIFKDLKLVYVVIVVIPMFSYEYFFMISLQIGFFPDERAFALRYQTAGMLETVLRQGVLGEDDTGEESPKWVTVISKCNIMFETTFA